MWRVVTVVAVSVLAVGVAAYVLARRDSEQSLEAGVVLYSIGVSTDPYGNSNPGGFGVVPGFRTGKDDRVEVRARGLGSFGGAEWIDDERILAARRAPPFLPAVIYRFRGGRLVRARPSPVPGLDTSQLWSPDGSLVASEPIASCGPRQPLGRCFRQSGRIYVQRTDGSRRRLVARGRHLGGWAPDGRLLVVDGRYPWRYRALDLRAGRLTMPLSPSAVSRRLGVKAVTVGLPTWSPDRRYVAALFSAKWPKRTNVFGALVIAFADGRVIRAITSPYSISMFAWAPVGQRLAYTTSGSPDPHELWVVDAPRADPRRIFMTRARHFDWITWSPDGRRLLVDEQLARRWLFLDPDGGARPISAPRPGGRPLWCCPVNGYSTLN